MEVMICRIGILMLGFSFGIFASFFQVPVFAQQEFPPQSVSPPRPPTPLVESPPPPLLSPPPLLVESPPSPIVPPHPTARALSPPPHTQIWSSPSPPPSKMQRHYPPPKRTKFRGEQRKLNYKEKVGLLFIAIAVTLQLFVAGILIFLRRQLIKVKDRYENVE